MNKNIEISICIPAYKNVLFLKRLLDSIASQSFVQYEVIITDDSPDDAVEDLVKKYPLQQLLSYYRNRPALGTPENWNEAIRKAQGKWIKLMHQDDHFTDEQALQKFYDATICYPDCRFFYSAFQNVEETTGKKKVVTCNFFDRLFLRISPLHLFKRVYIGNPSCTLVKRDADILYDRDFKFVVDFEYYIRCIRLMKQPRYISSVLLTIGFHEEQVTRYTFMVPEVQIPENFILLNKLGTQILYNPFVYDYYWRMLRNLGIRSEQQVRTYYQHTTPPLLGKMIRAQSKMPAGWLKNGLVSKAGMIGSYFISLFASHK